MDVEQYKEGIKKRREERLRLLRKKQRFESVPIRSTTSQSTELNKEDSERYRVIPNFEVEQREDLGMPPWVIKILVTLILVVGVYMVMNSDHDGLAQSQAFIQEVLHKEFNVAGVVSWYEDKTEGGMSFLPQLINRPKVDRESYGVPVNGGKVVSEFGRDQQGILVGTSSSLPIEVIKEGWVKSVEMDPHLGQIIVIDHGGQEESWYGQIQDVQVYEYDWVEQGQIIGYTGISNNGQGIFYFALKKNDSFVDPVDVITFD
jgi:stage IV sporulation protein FA